MRTIIVARRASAYVRRIMAGLIAGGQPPELLLSGSPVERLAGPIEKLLRVRRQLGMTEALHYVRRLGEKLPSRTSEPSLQELLAAGNCNHLLYDAVNSGQVLCEIADRAPSIVVLAGTGVVDRAFLAANHKGVVVNGHPALLPGIRGVDVLEWALAENRPLGVSAHLVETSVDAGELLVTSPIAIERDDTSLGALKARVIERQADAVVAAALALGQGCSAPWHHDLNKSVLRLTAPERIHAEARRVLARHVASLYEVQSGVKHAAD